MLCKVSAGKVNFISRNGKDWTFKFKNLVNDLAGLPVKQALLDGEVVLLDESGRTSFQLLQNSFKSSSSAPYLLYIFDLLYLDGYDLRDAPIEDRKAILELILPKDEASPLKYSEHVVGNGPDFFTEASKLKLEGIISKRLGSHYVAGRGNEWLKTKCSLREEFVIGGFTKPGGSRKNFGALLLGYYDKAHDFIYAGRVGTGFTERTLASLRQSFESLIQEKSSFKNLSGTTGQARGVTWLKPKLVAQIEFSNWTDDGQLRHPAFQGLREDKAGKSVVRDNAVSPKTIRSTSTAKASRTKSSGSETEIAGITLTHPDKVLYPDSGITKLDLAHYYEKIQKWILPQVEDRLSIPCSLPRGKWQTVLLSKASGTRHLRCS